MLGLDYVRTARAKGLSERTVVLRHATRNALLPVVTIIGLQLGALLSGAVLTETIFNLAGVGRTCSRRSPGRDYVVDPGVHPDHRAHLRHREPGRRRLLRLPRPAGPAAMTRTRTMTALSRPRAPPAAHRPRPTASGRPARRACGATRWPASCASARRSSGSSSSGSTSFIVIFADADRDPRPAASRCSASRTGVKQAGRAVHPPARLPGRPAGAHLRARHGNFRDVFSRVVYRRPDLARHRLRRDRLRDPHRRRPSARSPATPAARRTTS